MINIPHTDWLTMFAKNIKPSAYLEIGSKCGQTLKQVRPYCKQVYGVDPAIKPAQKEELYGADSNTRIFMMTSDSFFTTSNLPLFNLIFIDGKHTKEQVEKDFNNALNFLTNTGYILMHDTVPQTRDAAGGGTGTVWEFVCKLKYTIDHGVYEFFNLPCIYGLTVVHKRMKQVEWAPA